MTAPVPSPADAREAAGRARVLLDLWGDTLPRLTVRTADLRALLAAHERLAAVSALVPPDRIGYLFPDEVRAALSSAPTPEQTGEGTA